MAYLCKLFISHSLRLMPGILMGKGFSGMKGYGTLNQDFFLVGERPLWVGSGLTLCRSKGQLSAISGRLADRL